MADANQNEPPSIALQDLQALLQIVDVAAERGSFKGNELSTVGTIRDKLEKFLDFARQTEEAAKANAEEAAVVESTDPEIQGTPDAPAKPARKRRKAG